jgi:hypothetical protein
MNNVKEGSTSQKMLIDKELIFSTSLVSIYNQSIARTETRGIEARTAPIRELRLAISEMMTISPVVTIILSK